MLLNVKADFNLIYVFISLNICLESIYVLRLQLNEHSMHCCPDFKQNTYHIKVLLTGTVKLSK
jgi:hypothetical protein